MKLLIKNASVVNADNSTNADVLVDNGVIAKIGKGIKEKADKEIDARGKHLFPGFIDLHTHLRTPGREDEEDLTSGSQAAARGGFTTILCMPNTEPCIDNEGLAQWIVEQAQAIGIVDIYPTAAITVGREGKQLTEFEALKKAGCLALSDDGTCLQDALVLRRALEYAKMSNLLIISHSEDIRLNQQGVLRESLISSKYGISSIPEIAESVIVARDIELARYLDSRIHFAHISSARSLELIRQAKSQGIKVSCETCPHYFVLTVDDVERRDFDSNLKVNPPLGTKSDRAAIAQALKEGLIDCIATDHAPHSRAEKELPFENAPFGLIGLETAFSLTYTYLVKEGLIDLATLVEKLSWFPARILGLTKRGRIEQGFRADLVIADLSATWEVSQEAILSKSKNTPFLGYKLQGEVEYTIHKGKIIYDKTAR